MDTIETINKRYSCRRFKPDPVSEEDLNTILSAGMKAPVASNAYESLHLTIIEDKELLNDIGNKTTAMITKILKRRLDKNFGAPVMVVVSSKPAMMPGVEMANAACVLENMVLAATSLDIDNIIWAGPTAVFSNDPEMLASLEIPEGYKPVMVASFGYAVTKEETKNHTITVNRV